MTPKAQPTTPESIVIERRERIATIAADPYGDTPMLAAAYAAIGGYLTTEWSGTEGINIEFKYIGRTFRAVVEPVE